VDRDLVETHPEVKQLLAPERWPTQGGIRDVREALVAGRASRTEQLEKLAYAAGARTSELGLRRRQAIAREKTGRNLDRVTLNPCSRVVHLGRIPDLDSDGVSQYVAQGPVAIPAALEKAVLSSDKDAHKIAVGGLREVEDARDLGATRRGPRCRDRLLAPEESVEDIAARDAGFADRDRREIAERGWHRSSR